MSKIKSGYIVGHLTLKNKLYKTESGKFVWSATCDCGRDVDEYVLNRPVNKAASCGLCCDKSGNKLPFGEKFNKLKLVEKTITEEGVNYLWLCDCGNTTNVPLSNVTKGITKSCGCLQKENAVAYTDEKYEGKKFNRLTFIKHLCKWEGSITGTKPVALWSCDCGNEKVLRLDDVIYGKTKSCGCAVKRKKEVTSL